MDHILLEDPELARAFLLESDRQMSKLELTGWHSPDRCDGYFESVERRGDRRER